MVYREGLSEQSWYTQCCTQLGDRMRAKPYNAALQHGVTSPHVRVCTESLGDMCALGHNVPDHIVTSELDPARRTGSDLGVVLA